MDCDLKKDVTTKVIDLQDNLGQLHYKVAFYTTSRMRERDLVVQNVYVVKVINASNYRYPVLLVEKQFYNKSQAIMEFKKQVENYSTLVKSQSRCLDDINLYKEKINYRKIDPDCCLNCRFCHNDHTGMHLECHNRNNFVFEPGCPNDNHHYHTDEFLRIFPKVQNNGICDNYKRRDKTDKRLNPDFSHELDWIIDRHVEQRVDQEMEYIQNGIIDANSGDADEIN